jgi:hypothetical protein
MMLISITAFAVGLSFAACLYNLAMDRTAWGVFFLGLGGFNLLLWFLAISKVSV